MRENGLKKSPTMIDLCHNRKMCHTFMAEYCFHPRFKEIDYIIKELTKKVKKLWYVPATKYVLQDLDEKEKTRREILVLPQ